jgi:uncharacterized protein
MDNNLNQFTPEKKSFLEKYNISPILFAFLSLFILFVSYQIIAGAITVLFLGMDIEKMDISLLRLFTGLGQLIFILIPTILLARLLPAKMKEVFSLRKTPFLVIIITIICTFSLQEVLQILLLMQEQIPIPQSLRSIVEDYKKMMEESYRILVNSKSMFELSTVVLVAAIIPAICEEMFFRGLFQHNLINKLGPKWGIILCGIVFGLFHFNPFAIIPLVFLGIFFGFLVYRSGSILPAMVAHFTNNFFASIADYFFKTDDLILKDTKVEITMENFAGIAFIFSISLILFLFSLNLFIKRTGRNHINKVV